MLETAHSRTTNLLAAALIVACCALLAGVACAQERVIYTDTSLAELRQCLLDGSSNQSLNSSAGNSAFVLAYDYLNQKLYWTDSNTKSIVKADIDGGNQSSVISGLSSPVGIALDPVNQKIYWTQDSNSLAPGIYRAGYDGSNLETLVTSAQVGDPVSLALDVKHGKMYWAETTGSKIARANLDGTNLEVIFSDAPGPVGILVDYANDKVYWADTSALKIERSNFDGSSREEAVTYTPGVAPRYIAFNPVTNDIYWTAQSGQGIYRAQVGVGAFGTLIASSSQPQGIALILNCSSSGPDSDGDGTADCSDACPKDSAKTALGLCGCGVAETDTDSDGTPDCNDSCASDPAKTAAGICGCGTSDTDTDLDGTADCIDKCPSDPNKIDPEQCGCGKFEVNFGAGLECTNAPALTRHTTLDDPPDVDVNGKKVIIVLEKFSGGSLNSQTFAFSALLKSAAKARKKLSVQYKVTVQVAGKPKRDILQLITKRNQLTIRGLRPGSYTVKYRAQAVRDGDVVFSTRPSTATAFEVH